MKREKLFRGKRFNGEWVYGWYSELLCYNKTTMYLITEKTLKTIVHQVDPETVEEFIGLIDKNKVKIFEGDKVKFDIGTRENRKVISSNSSFGFVGLEDNRETIFTEFVPICTISKSLMEIGEFRDLSDIIEVIGNIHDKN